MTVLTTTANNPTMRIQTILILLLTSLSLTGQGIMLAGGAVAEGAEFAPTDIANCVGWFSATDVDGDGIEDEVGESITTWVNKGSNGDNLSVNGNPSLSTLNGHNSIYFDGTGDYYTGSTPSDWTFLHDGTLHTVFVVTNVSAGQPEAVSGIFSTAGASTEIGAGFFWYTNQNILYLVVKGSSNNEVVFVFSGSNTFNTGSTFMFRTEGNVSTTTAADRIEIFKNGTDLNINNTETNLPVTNEPSNNLTVGARAPGDARYLKGYISELIFYNRALTVDEKSQVESYLSTKYGL